MSPARPPCRFDDGGDGGEYTIAKMPKKSDGKNFGAKEYVDGGYLMWTLTPEQLDDYVEDELSEVTDDVKWIGKYKAAEHRWLEREFGEYFGNEASTAEFYTKAAFVAQVPAFAARSKSLPRAGSLTAAHVATLASKAASPPTKATDAFAAGDKRKAVEEATGSSEEVGGAKHPKADEASPQGGAGGAGSSGAGPSGLSHPATAPPVLFPEPEPAAPSKCKSAAAAAATSGPRQVQVHSRRCARTFVYHRPTRCHLRVTQFRLHKSCPPQILCSSKKCLPQLD